MNAHATAARTPVVTMTLILRGIERVAIDT